MGALCYNGSEGTLYGLRCGSIPGTYADLQRQDSSQAMCGRPTRWRRTRHK